MDIRYKVITYVEKKQDNGDYYHDDVILHITDDLEDAKSTLKQSKDHNSRIYKQTWEHLQDGIYDWGDDGEVYLDYYDVID